MSIIKRKPKKSQEKEMPSEMEGAKKAHSLPVALGIKKMAKGGMIESSRAPSMPEAKPDDKRLPMDEYMASHFAEGGIVDGIMRKRKAKMMAEGGMVDIEENAEEGPADLDWANEDAALKELYDDSQLSAQPMDSNEHGDDIDSDKHDMISAIRKKMMAKRGMR